MGTVGSLERGGGARPQLVQPGLSKFRDEILDGKKKQATQRPEKAQKQWQLSLWLLNVLGKPLTEYLYTPVYILWKALEQKAAWVYTLSSYSLGVLYTLWLSDLSKSE